MKKIFAALTGLLMIGGCVSNQTFRDTDFVIRGDTGGNVLEYQTKAQKVKGRRVVVDGGCYSSCLFYLSSFSSGTYCATERADLGFHSIFFVRTDNDALLSGTQYVAKSKKLTDDFLDSLTPSLRNYYKGQKIPSVYEGDGRTTVSHLKGKKAIELLGAC